MLPERVTSVLARPHTYPNGDRCQFLNIGFRCRLLGGVARVNDDESVAVGWFAPDRLPPLDEHGQVTITHALAPDSSAAAWFAPDSAALSAALPGVPGRDAVGYRLRRPATAPVRRRGAVGPLRIGSGDSASPPPGSRSKFGGGIWGGVVASRHPTLRGGR